MEARYLNDELEEVLNQPCFLDSQDLRNLNLMITRACCNSDVIILIAPATTLHARTASSRFGALSDFKAPMVCAVDGRGWPGLASDQLSDLEATLGHEGAATVCDAIQAVLDVAGEHGEQAPSIDGIGREILTALRVGERLEACATINQPSAPTRDASPERSGRGRAFSTEAIAYSEQRYRYSGTSPKPNGFALAPTIMRAADVDTLSREVGEQPWTKRLSPLRCALGCAPASRRPSRHHRRQDGWRRARWCGPSGGERLPPTASVASSVGHRQRTPGRRGRFNRSDVPGARPPGAQAAGPSP